MNHITQARHNKNEEAILCEIGEIHQTIVIIIFIMDQNYLNHSRCATYRVLANDLRILYAHDAYLKIL